MKWIGLLIILAAILPVARWLWQNPNETPKVWMLMGFLPFVLAPLHLYVAVISWAGWAGHVQGAEFSVLDGIAIVLYLSVPSASRPIPFRISMGLYFFTALLSVIQANVPMAALFYSWQLARMFLIYAVITRAWADTRVVPALLKGMAAGLILEACLAIWQRFGLGMLQVDGTFGHQNFLGMLSHLVVFPFFALLLARRGGWLSVAVTLAGVVVEALTASRATIGLAGIAFALLFTLSALGRWTSRKATLLLVALAAAAIIAPFAISSIDKRGDASFASSDDERIALNSAAVAILSDHPLGVGANHFVMIANTGGYYQNAGVAWTSYGAVVHDLYLLVAAETGYPGLIAFMILLLGPMIVAFRCGWQNRGDPRGDLLLGLGVGLLTVYVHSIFEWVFITFDFEYVFAIEIGLVASLAQQLGYWRKSYPKAAQLGARAMPVMPNGRTRGLSRGYQDKARA